ncbi:methyltransferase domain-containing protein [Halomontanus rarus]|uniref:methyltransferase domain-containing protein n=1 Tax=Halomontanus rarus TaxID=3034020 RepID=UPI001A98D89C
MEDDSPVEDHYDALADRWTEFTEGPWKKRVLWPMTRSLLPEVAGKRVLDVGCGDGTYSAWLADQGADVLGIDLSREMISVARENHGEDAEFQRADITDSLSGVDDREFDLVCCQHVFSHLPELDGPLAEFARVLEPGGTVVISTHHPFHDFLVVREREYPETSEIDGMDLEPDVDPRPDDPTYYDTEQFEIYWAGPESSNPGTYYRRSLNGLLQPLLDAGFELRELVEPDLRAAVDADDLDLSGELRRRPPRSICLRAER